MIPSDLCHFRTHRKSDWKIFGDAFAYDPVTGAFVSLLMRGKARVGRISTPKSDGYVYLGMNGKEVLGHRAAWVAYYGCDAPKLIDHKNCRRSDNAISNLRAADRAINAANWRSPSGLMRSIRITRTGRFKALLNAGGRQVSLGLYDTLEEAAAVYRAAMKSRFGEVNL